MDKEHLHHEIEQLRSIVRQMQKQMAALESRVSPVDHPMREVFLAKITGKQWQEQQIAGGVVSDWTAGRKCTSDTDPSAIQGTSGSTVLLEIRDGNNFRYVAMGVSGITVRLTSRDGTNLTKYAWAEEKRTAAGWSAVTGGQSGSLASDPAYMMDSTVTDDHTNEHALIVKVHDTWVIVGLGSGAGATFPAGSDLQVFQRHPAGTVVCDWVKFHS
jgi:hypothetical protein